MSRKPARALVLLLAALAAGCGEGEPAGSGRLVVDKSLSGGPSYMEGSLTELTVRDEDGRPVARARQAQSGGGPLLDRTLPAGTYRLISHERPCQGNCGLLDPPAARCEAEVEVRRDRTTRAYVLLAGGATECGTA